MGEAIETRAGACRCYNSSPAFQPPFRRKNSRRVVLESYDSVGNRMSFTRNLGYGLRSAARLVILIEAAGEGCLHFVLRRLRGPIPPVERARWLHESCKRGLRRLGIVTETYGQFPSRGLLVSNHLSYLDIL